MDTLSILNYLSKCGSICGKYSSRGVDHTAYIYNMPNYGTLDEFPAGGLV